MDDAAIADAAALPPRPPPAPTPDPVSKAAAERATEHEKRMERARRDAESYVRETAANREAEATEAALDDAPPPLAEDPPAPPLRPTFASFSWANKSREELRITLRCDEGDGVDEVSVGGAVKATGADVRLGTGTRTAVEGDVTCTLAARALPRRVAATPRLPRGYSVETGAPQVP